MLALWLACCGLLLTVGGCDKPPAPALPEDQEALIQAGGTAIRVGQFQQALATAQAAYDAAALRQADVVRELKMRLLDQLTQEALIQERGRVLGMSVGEDELEQAVTRIRIDYPEESFDQMLLQQAVSFPVWREQLRLRLLADKVIAADLADQVAVEPQEIVALAAKLPPAEAVQMRGEAGEAAQRRLMQRLRRRKLEAAYPVWIENLRRETVATVDTERWNRLLNP